MGLRTVQILGKAYSMSGQVSVTCSYSGVQVYSGTVPTAASNPPVQNIDYGPMLSFDVPTTLLNRVVTSSITVTNGTFYLADISVNKVVATDWALFQPQFRDLTTPGAQPLKQNVKLDGVLIDTAEPMDGWHYEIPNGSTLTLNWNLSIVPRFSAGNVWQHPTELLAGVQYTITKPGNTDWTLLGASASIPGTVFTATGAAASGKGACIPVDEDAWHTAMVTAGRMQG